MVTNLVDAFDPPDRGKREFCLPLASETATVPDGTLNDWSTINNLAPSSLFSIEDDRSPVEPILTIRISPPDSGSFPDDGNLPHPAIRLHAIGRGKLTFIRGNANTAHSLKLEMTMLLGNFVQEKLGVVVGQNLPLIPWFDRWKEANCIPKFVFYENVDLDHLQFLIATLVEPPAAGQESLAKEHGLSLPQQLTEIQRSNFLTEFLSGAQSIVTHPGACVGQVATDPADTTSRLLRLRCEYANGNPMNTRELFYLLFGNDSQEAEQHPLLKKMEELGQSETLEPASKRLLLRPPLRTHARVMWEAEEEIATTPTNWASAKLIEPDDLCNEDSDFRSQGYNNDFKCNMFTEDMCLRSGFRVPVWTVNGKNQYVGATYLSQMGYKIGTAGSPAQLLKDQKVWGRKWDARIKSIANLSRRVEFINRMMNEEGRCFILTKQRNGKLPSALGGPSGLPSLTGSAGHAVVIKQVIHTSRELNGNTIHSLEWVSHTLSNGQAKLLLQSIAVSSYEAWDLRAVEVNLNWFFALWPGGPRAIDHESVADEDDDNQLALIELHPGGDPFTEAGLKDLNVVVG